MHPCRAGTHNVLVVAIEPAHEWNFNVKCDYYIVEDTINTRVGHIEDKIGEALGRTKEVVAGSAVNNRLRPQIVRTPGQRWFLYICNARQ